MQLHLLAARISLLDDVEAKGSHPGLLHIVVGRGFVPVLPQLRNQVVLGSEPVFFKLIIEVQRESLWVDASPLRQEELLPSRTVVARGVDLLRVSVEQAGLRLDDVALKLDLELPLPLLSIAHWILRQNDGVRQIEGSGRQQMTWHTPAANPGLCGNLFPLFAVLRIS